jgi:hypothetical protein
MMCEPYQGNYRMGGEDKVSDTGAFVLYDHVTSKTRLLNTLGGVLGEEDGTTVTKVLEAQATLREMTENSPLEHLHQPEIAQAGWTQRVLAWFRKD